MRTDIPGSILRMEPYAMLQNLNFILQVLSEPVTGISTGRRAREKEAMKMTNKTRSLENPTEKEMQRMNKLIMVYLYNNKILLSNKKE